jgi:hypothetical protein
MSTHRNLLVPVLALSLVLLTCPGIAMEEQVKLNQVRALAGGITPGDGPGFPITITLPGRYIITSNLYPPAGANGIEIKAHDVTIDFSGFRLQGLFQAKYGVV